LLRSSDLSKAIADQPPFEDTEQEQTDRIRHLRAIEELEANGERYRGDASDTLGSALIWLNRKTHKHCKAPGCHRLGSFQPYDEYPHVLFCDHHAARILRDTVLAIEEATV